MAIEPVRWDELKALESDVLKTRLFSLLQDLAVEIQAGEPDDPDILGAVPRLADLISERPDAASYSQLLSSLARSVGLWNYIDTSHSDTSDAFVAEAVTVEKLGGITLHKEQIAALNVLLAGKNLILSAPTSFGKSILIDALLLSGRYSRVAIVLPTIALLDEFRRRLVARFGSDFDILMHHSEAPSKAKVIFLGTQERLINREDLGTLDLVVVDEFYKLDPARRDDRSVTLNAAVYQLLRRARQFFFLGPNIESVQIASNTRWRFEFLRTRFSTVAVDTFDLKGVADKDARLVEEVYKEDNWPALVFVSSPDKANQLAADLADTDTVVGMGSELATWIDLNYGGRWELSKAVASGVGVHHGRIPRALASRFVKLFNDRMLPILICTSTLIEGVNTAAKAVLIYDKTINREQYDFFTFSNIRGRAGRLGQHHVGKVFLFHSPPGHEDVDVNPPLFGDLDSAPDEFVVHIAQEEASDAISDRVSGLIDRLGLTWEEVKRLSSIGIDTIEAVKDKTKDALGEQAQLSWTGHPRYDEFRAVCEIICSVRRPREFGVTSANQLAMYLNKLRQSTTMRAFFSWHSTSYRGELDKLDNVFKFLRACEYSLPELFGCVELFVTKAGERADYSLFTAEMPRWFRPEVLKVLEEQGVPIQIAERFGGSNETVATLTRKLRDLAMANDPRLSRLECAWILDALPA
ncbi:DEAD/DEAH box helicase [Hyphomicrobium sp.]|uniref:DEAD/DEAH box helicase n=1 Tax=Hyphomicrobium sp. TaxID=82 RepID=UPI002E35D240|nr:DEAD/DEAH box helicase [Hyphomicrobium sp.]HEX2843483.1 DEAD/DEAH box helicase [Hyphomicrobium sp.]